MILYLGFSHIKGYNLSMFKMILKQFSLQIFKINIYALLVIYFLFKTLPNYNESGDIKFYILAFYCSGLLPSIIAYLITHNKRTAFITLFNTLFFNCYFAGAFFIFISMIELMLIEQSRGFVGIGLVIFVIVLPVKLLKNLELCRPSALKTKNNPVK
jgi:hypothetical protein